MVLRYGNLILQVLKNIVKLGILQFVYCCIYHLKHILGYSALGQMHISTQLQFRNVYFLLDAFNSNNHIVKSCMRAALYNSNTCIGYELAFYRDLDIYNNCTSGRKLINDHNLSYDQLAIVSNLSTLIDIRAGNFYIDGFTINDIDLLIEGIATG